MFSERFVGEHMTGASGHVLVHKFFVPQTYQGVVQRVALLNRLHAGIAKNSQAQVFVLHGPAGHGKSTLMQQFCHALLESPWQTAWLTLDDADNDPKRFESHMHALFHSLAVQDIVKNEHLPHSNLLDKLLDELAQIAKPVVLFLDDFHLLTAPYLLVIFRNLLSKLPPHVRMVLGSRNLPQIGMSRLQAHHTATTLGVADLRFSAQESADFFAQESDLDTQEVAAIHRRVEGWPAGMQLYRLAIRHPDVRDSLVARQPRTPRELVDYLTENVLNLQSVEVQDFLCKSALLRQLCAPLCDEVLQITHAKELLAQLEQGGLFIRPLDSQGIWYQYHAIFSDVLANILIQNDPATVSEIHQRAAHWYRSHQQWEEALHHEIAAKRFNSAAEILDVWASSLIANAELVTMQRWYEKIPMENICERTGLMIKAAYAMMFLRQLVPLKALLILLSTRQGQGQIDDTSCPDVVLAMAAIFMDDLPRSAALVQNDSVMVFGSTGFADFERAAAANVLAFTQIAQGKFAEAGHSLGFSQALSERSHAPFSSGYHLAVRAISLIVQGHPQAALTDLQGSHPANKKTINIDHSLASAATVASLLWALYETGHCAGVRVLWSRHAQAIAASLVPDFNAIAHLAATRAYVMNDEIAQGLGVLDSLERIARQGQWTRVLRVVLWERERLAAMHSEVRLLGSGCAGVPDATSASAIDGWVLLSEDFGGDVLGRIRRALHANSTVQALKLLASAHKSCTGRGLLRIRLCMLQSLCCLQRTQHREALRWASQALHFARLGGAVRCLVDEGEKSAQVLRMLCDEINLTLPESHSKEGLDLAHGWRVLGDLGAPSSQDQKSLASGEMSDLGTVPRTVPGLSAKQTRVLTLLARGASNQEIARSLYISENTVKYHLKGIYSTLGVTDRMKAMNVARTVLIALP